MVFIDFETQSDVDIKECGLYKYVRGLYFAPVCMAYAIDDGPVELWLPGEPLPKEIATGSDLNIFNAEFEYNVFHSNWFRYNEYDVSKITYNNMIDTQAIAATFGFPINLKNLAQALDVKHQKDNKGTYLIKKLCVVKNGKVPAPSTFPRDFENLYEYCKQDVRTLRACYNYMIKKKLSPFENKVWQHTLKQNAYGLPVDTKTIRQIIRVLNTYKDQCNLRLSKITDGEITAGTQNQRIVSYIRKRDSRLLNLQSDHVQSILDEDILDKKCTEILQIRQKTSKSSTAKFTKAINMLCPDDRIRGSLKYHKSHTGRFAGTGFQIHNLPRAKHDNPDAVIEDFFLKPIPYLIEKYGNIGEAASKLVRPIIKAPEGKKLIVADYVSVENVCLHWVAGDTDTTNDFFNKIDQYKRYASRRFNIGYDDVNKDQRTYAKPSVLGLGYGGGPGALQRVAINHGIELSYDQADADKRFYRNMYPQVPKLWRRVHDSMIRAVQDETLIELYTGTVTLRIIKRGSYAFILLPSGRFLSYPAPQIQTDAQYGNPCFTYMGIDHAKQWRRLGDQHRSEPDMPVHGGRLVENIIQGIARDLLACGLLYLEASGFEVIASVHDEIISEIDDKNATDSNLERYCNVMCVLPDWAEGLPLRAEGYIAERYRKD